jgi:transposase
MKHDHISFIYYNMDQLILPLDLEILIPEHHLARVVHEAVEQLDDSILQRDSRNHEESGGAFKKDPSNQTLKKAKKQLSEDLHPRK